MEEKTGSALFKPVTAGQMRYFGLAFLLLILGIGAYDIWNGDFSSAMRVVGLGLFLYIARSIYANKNSNPEAYTRYRRMGLIKAGIAFLFAVVAFGLLWLMLEKPDFILPLLGTG